MKELVELAVLILVAWGVSASVRFLWLAGRQKAKGASQGKLQWKGEVLSSNRDAQVSLTDQQIVSVTAEWFTHFFEHKLLSATRGRAFHLRICYALAPGGQLLQRIDVDPLSHRAFVTRFVEEALSGWPVLPSQMLLIFQFYARVRVREQSLAQFPAPFSDLAARHGHTKTLEELLLASLEQAPLVTSCPLMTEDHWLRCLEALPGNRVILRARATWRQESGRPGEALADWNSLIEEGKLRGEEEATDYANRGVLLANLNQPERAVEDLEKAWELDTTYWRVAQILAETLRRLKRAAEAVTVISKAILRHTGVAPLYLSRGLAHFDLEKFHASERDFSRAIKLAQDWPEPYFRRALVRARQERKEEAVSDLDRWAELENKPPVVMRMRIELLFAFQQWQRMLNAVAVWSETEEVDATLHILRGRALAMLGKLELAIEAFTAATTSDDVTLAGWGRAWRALALVQLDDYAAAVPDADIAIEQKILVSRMRWVRAMAAWNDDLRDAAIREMELAVEFDSQDEFARFWQARFLSGAGQFAEARTVLEGMHHETNDWEALWLRGSIAAELGDTNTAWQDLTAALSDPSVPAEVRMTRIRIALDQGDWIAAEADLNTLIEQDEENAEAYWVRAQLALRRGDLDEGLRDLKAAHQLGLHPPELGLAWCRALIYRKRYDESLEVAARYQEDYPENSEFILLPAEIAARQFGPGAGDETLQKAIAAYPEQSDLMTTKVLLSEAQFEHEAEHYDAACRLATEAIEFETSLVSYALHLRAAAYWYGGQFVEALEDYEQILQETPDDETALLGRGQVLTELGEADAALTYLDQCIEKISPHGPSSTLAYALNGRAAAKGALGEYSVAWKDWTESLLIRPENAWLHFNAGWLSLQTRDWNAAQWSFRLALQCDSPGLPPRKRAAALAAIKRGPLPEDVRPVQE